jgi:hypothetical protein
MPGTSRVAGVVTGTDALPRSSRSSARRTSRPRCLDVLASGTRVVTVQRNRAQANRGLDITALNLFTLVEGKIASMHSFDAHLPLGPLRARPLLGSAALRLGGGGRLPPMTGGGPANAWTKSRGTWTRAGSSAALSHRATSAPQDRRTSSANGPHIEPTELRRTCRTGGSPVARSCERSRQQCPPDPDASEPAVATGTHVGPITARRSTRRAPT